MIIDANEVESGTNLHCDLCIIGGGTAGIILAREFDDSDLNVWLLESGGFEIEQDTQELYTVSQNSPPTRFGKVYRVLIKKTANMPACCSPPTI